ncbi:MULTISPECIES: YgaP family membrane protein [unclassified Moraxella]|uniref:YgaP family membrane protein n=1 Tax=unclassified Moraxella TaxID=2685852 RepID=UPI003AF66B01
MTKNMSTLERIARIGVGCAIVRMGKKNQSALAKIGYVPMLTGVAGYCPMKSAIFGDKYDRNTAKSDDSKCQKDGQKSCCGFGKKCKKSDEQQDAQTA